jgi:hypothetical protein
VTKGVDLVPAARRVLHTEQVLLGIQAASHLFTSPLPGELLPVRRTHRSLFS